MEGHHFPSTFGHPLSAYRFDETIYRRARHFQSAGHVSFRDCLDFGSEGEREGFSIQRRTTLDRKC